MNPAARRDYVKRRNAAFRLEMRSTKHELLKTAKAQAIKGVSKTMTKEQIVKRIIGWHD
jgi:hypothetical protein